MSRRNFMVPFAFRSLSFLTRTGGLAFLACWGLSQPGHAELTPGTQGARDRHVTQIVRLLLDQQHLSRHPLNDEISQRALKTYLKQLDPMKVYFYQSDIDEFQKSENLLDDQLKAGDFRFAYLVFNRFLTRLDERLALIPKLIEMSHDYSLDEELVVDPEAATYAKTPAEAEDRWRKRIKFDLLNLKGDKVETAEAHNRLRRRYRSVGVRMHQYKPDDLLEIFLSSVTSAYDPHTSYMSPTSLDNFEISMRLKLDGIGAALSLEDGYTVVSRVIPGGAADKQGELKPEDQIEAVAQGESGEFVDVLDMRLNDVVDMIRGKAGTTVRLRVKHSDASETKEVKIVRDRIELKDEEARGSIINTEAQKPNGQPYRIGVVRLPSFYMDMEAARRNVADFKSTTRDVRKILNDFRRQGIDAVMLDLRFNGGGSLTEAIDLTGLFIDIGPVVQVKDPDKNVTKYNDDEQGTAWDGPLVVVTNKFSASASEILAGAIQDYQRGIIVGDQTTHGKGTVQSLQDLSEKIFGPGIANVPSLGALKITMQQFYRPNGDSTQKRGVVSDIVLPSTTNEMEIGEADLDYPVEFDTVPPAEYSKYGRVSPEAIQALREKSSSRISASEEFAKVNRRIERYREQKKRDFVSINEEAFFARRKEFDADKEEEDNIKKGENTTEIVFDQADYYNRELLDLTVDYLQLVGTGSVVAAQR